MSINIDGLVYLDSREMAAEAGITLDRLRGVIKPKPDLVIGRSNHYRPATVARWVKTRGGRR